MIKKLLYFSIATSFFAAQIFTINLSVFQLSLFRASVLVVPIMLALYMLKYSSGISLMTYKSNRYSIKFMILWLLYSFISILWVNDYGSAMRSLYFIISGVICTLLFSIFFKQENHYKIIIKIFVTMIFLHNLIGWYEIITRDYRFLSLENKIYYSSITKGIPISMLGNPNDFATLTLFGIVISIIAHQIFRTKPIRFVSKALFVSNIILLFTTNSRANILGLFIGIVVLVMILRKKKSTILVGMFIILILSLLAIQGDIINIINAKFRHIITFDFNTQNLNSDSTRLNLIKNGVHFLKSTYGFGTGVGNIEYWMENKSIFPTRGVTNIHNWWMEILVGYGIGIFILYISFYYKLFKDMLTIYKNTSSSINKNIALGFLLFMASFTIASLSSSSNIAKEWLWVFWSVCIAFQGYAMNKSDE